MTNLAPRQAVVYARRSQKQENGASVTEQVRLGREACDESGWHLTEVIDQDFKHSASRFAKKDRPGWARLLSMLRAGLADVVILWESSRGDRKLGDWVAFLDLCREHGILIHVVSDERTFDPQKRGDRKALATAGIASEDETELISQRVQRGIAAASKRGEPRGHPPYGYRAVYDEETGKRSGWRIIDEEAQIVRWIFEQVAERKTLQWIMRDLNERSVPSPKGMAWTWQHIRYMAMNCAYAGLVRLQDGELITGIWPPIVTRAEWAAAMEVFEPRRETTRPGKQKHLLSVLAECQCGQDVVVRTVSGRLRYSCRTGCFYLPYEWLDEFVSDVICERLARPDARDLFRSDDERTGQLHAEIKELQGQLDEWAKAAISPRAYEIKEAQLLPKIQARQRELDVLTVPAVLRDILAAADIRAAWNGYTVQAKRAIIRVLTEIIVRPVEGRARGRGPRTDLTEDRVRFTWEPRPDGRQRTETDLA